MTTMLSYPVITKLFSADANKAKDTRNALNNIVALLQLYNLAASSQDELNNK